MTRFLSDEGVAQITDYVPVGKIDDGAHHELVRQLHGVRGTFHFRIECFPRFDYARGSHEIRLVEGGVVFDSSKLSLGLATDLEFAQEGDGVVAMGQLTEGESAVIVLRGVERDAHCGPCLTPEVADELFRDTVDYWRCWLSQCTYTGRWREQVHRSALTLKLLTYEPTGAIVAAPTCSLPEDIGGGRNWDYRYTWIRDAAFTLYGLLRIGFTDEAAHFMQWIEARCHELNPEVGAFVQSYDSNALEAANLVMPLVFFLSPTDPRILDTLDAINRPPREGGLVEDSLVFRYRSDDGLAGGEGSFNMCTFWLVEAMTRAGRVDKDRLESARLLFEQMLSYANHLGLYAEETGPKGEALGNFPQAFTHLSLISAAYNLDRALGDNR